MRDARGRVIAISVTGRGVRDLRWLRVAACRASFMRADSLATYLIFEMVLARAVRGASRSFTAKSNAALTNAVTFAFR